MAKETLFEVTVVIIDKKFFWAPNKIEARKKAKKSVEFLEADIVRITKIKPSSSKR